MLDIVFVALTIVICGFLFWRNMRRLGFEDIGVLDLLLLVILVATAAGKLLSLWWPLVFIPAALFFGSLAFFWYCNQRRWSGWEVGDQATVPFVIGYLLLTISHFVVNAGTLFYAASALILLVLNIFLFNRREFRGYRLFLNLVLISVFLMVSGYWLMANDRFGSLTFLTALLLLCLVGIFKRFKKTVMADSPLDFIAKLKHLLLEKKREITEQQLKLPQDDPFFDPKRADSNSPEEDADEQVGHRDYLAQEAFLTASQKQVDSALSKIEKGTYGRCEKCGGKIEPERLEAMPEAVLCIKCANK